jgi:hypothetical protein
MERPIIGESLADVNEQYGVFDLVFSLFLYVAR